MVSQSKCYLLLEFISLLLDFYVTLHSLKSSSDVVNVLAGLRKM